MPYHSITPNLILHYLDENSSGTETIVLLHGLGVNVDSWAYQIPALIAANYRVIAVDLRGFGQSTFPGGKVRIPDMAADLLDLLDTLEIQQVGMIGISMGGVVAQQFALEFSSRVEKLVLVNTFASLQPDNLSQFIYYYFRLLMVHTLGIKAQANVVAHRIFPQREQEALRQQLREQVLTADPRAYRGIMRELRRFDIVDRLPEIQVPTLVITAENDSTVSPQRQTFLANCLPNARQIFIPNANHGVTIDQPHLFNQILLEFLESS
jgi:3-oxoadipate enol-lactonase